MVKDPDLRALEGGQISASKREGARSCPFHEVLDLLVLGELMGVADIAALELKHGQCLPESHLLVVFLGF